MIRLQCYNSKLLGFPSVNTIVGRPFLVKGALLEFRAWPEGLVEGCGLLLFALVFCSLIPQGPAVG